MARADGVTRILVGDDRDDLFGGNSRYATQRVFGFYQQLPAALRRTLLEPFFGIGAVASRPLLSNGASFIRQVNAPLPDRGQEYNLLRRMGSSSIC